MTLLEKFLHRADMFSQLCELAFKFSLENPLLNMLICRSLSASVQLKSRWTWGSSKHLLCYALLAFLGFAQSSWSGSSVLSHGLRASDSSLWLSLAALLSHNPPNPNFRMNLVASWCLSGTSPSLKVLATSSAFRSDSSEKLCNKNGRPGPTNP